MKNEVERALEVYKELGIKADVGYVYILKAENGLYKIGKSRSPQTRVNNIRTASPVKIEVYRVFMSTEYSDTEIRLHELFADFREIGEWFRLTDEELLTIDEMQGDHTLTPCYL
jgi:predicted Zn-dependent protease with MMP-like domain